MHWSITKPNSEALKNKLNVLVLLVADTGDIDLDISGLRLCSCQYFLCWCSICLNTAFARIHGSPTVVLWSRWSFCRTTYRHESSPETELIDRLHWEDRHTTTCACFTNDTKKAKKMLCQLYDLSDYLQVAGTEGSFQRYYGNQYITNHVFLSQGKNTFERYSFFVFYICDHGIKVHILGGWIKMVSVYWALIVETQIRQQQMLLFKTHPHRSLAGMIRSQLPCEKTYILVNYFSRQCLQHRVTTVAQTDHQTLNLERAFHSLWTFSCHHRRGGWVKWCSVSCYFQPHSKMPLRPNPNTPLALTI